jgi:hypothetical protein
MEDRTVHIDLELHLHDEEIRGHAHGDGRRGREFAGWLGLITAIDELLEGAGHGGPAAPAVPPD